jgi:hypothetical protein
MPKNQTSFKKGEIHNPNGRPKSGWTMRDEYLKALERETLDGTPMKQGVAEALVDKALQGDVIAIKEVNNRIDGMPKQTTEFDLGDKTLDTLIKLD